MRPIKFRGKRIDNSEWVYGHYVVYSDESHCIVQPGAKTRKGSFVRNYEVDPETVSQFTGLHDKNGEEIYEGDILRVPTINKGLRLCKVTWSKYGWFPWTMMRNIDEHIEIIGNATENPELIEEKKL